MAQIIASEYEKAVAKGLKDAVTNALPAAATVACGIGKFGIGLAWEIAKTAYTATKITVNAASDAIASYQAQVQTAKQSSAKQPKQDSDIVDAEVVS